MIAYRSARRRTRIGAAALTLAAVIALLLVPVQAANAASVQITSPVPGPAILVTNPLIAGTADAGDRVTVTTDLPEVTGCTARANSAGAWSCRISGLYSTSDLTLTATRPGGTPGDSASLGFSALMPPTVNPSGPTQVPALSGTGYQGATILAFAYQGEGSFPCYDGGELPIVANDGTWSCSFEDTGLDDGTFTIRVRQAAEFAPNTSEQRVTSVVLDRAADDPYFTAPGVSSSDGEALPVSTSNRTPVIRGTGEPGATATVWYGLDPQYFYDPYCTAVVSAAGTWACTAPFTLAVGTTYYFSNFQRDAAGNTSRSPDREMTVTIVQGPATPRIDTPLAGASLDFGVVTVRGADLSENPGTIRVREKGKTLCTAPVSETFSWNCRLTGLDAGSHTLSVVAIDGYGTASDPATRAFSLKEEPVPPLIPTQPRATILEVPPLEWTLGALDSAGQPLAGVPVIPGDAVTLVASDIPAGMTATAELHSDPVFLATQEVGDTGSFAIPVIVPADTPPGDHEFVVTLAGGGRKDSTRSFPVTIGAAPAPTPTPEPTEAPASGDNTGGATEEGRFGTTVKRGPGADEATVLSNALPTAQTLKLGPTALAITGAAAAAFVLIAAFPAKLLELTVSENYSRMFGWLAAVRRRFERARTRVRSWAIPPMLTTLGMVLATSVILGFSDPGFGFSWSSLRLLAALFVSLFVLNVLIATLVQWVADRRFSAPSTLVPMPAALLLVVASVVISRLGGIQPGFFFGLVIGIGFAVELAKRPSALLTLLGVGVSMVVGVGTWLGYSALANVGGSDPGWLVLFGREALAAMTLEALATSVIALLPLAFLDGRSIWEWSRWAWAGIYAVAVALFVIVIVPLSDNWGEFTAPLFGWGVFFGIFTLIAVGVWAFFRFSGMSAKTVTEE